MNISLIDITGFAAGVLTTLSFSPQVKRSWKTRDLSGISLRMYILFTGGVALWTIYGIFLSSLPIIITNAITFVLAGTVLYLKIKHK